jgi:hypothetical protein
LLRGAKGFLQGIHQPVHSLIEAGVADVESVAAAKLDEGPREIPGARHAGATHQDWDYANVAIECGSDFDGDPIRRIPKPRLTAVVRGGKPVFADDGDQHVAGSDHPLYLLREVVTRLKSVDIPKQVMVGAEMGAQPVVKTTRVAAAILVPVADENVGHDFQ